MPIMHGPGISNPNETVERNVPQCDVQAYKAVGYVMGKKPKESEVAEVVVSTNAPDKGAEPSPAPKFVKKPFKK